MPLDAVHVQEDGAVAGVLHPGGERLGDFEEPTAAYAVLNLDAGIQLMVGGRLHSITARVDNVFDTEYRNHLSRIKDLMPQPGRNFALLYRVTI